MLAYFLYLGIRNLQRPPQVVDELQPAGIWRWNLPLLLPPRWIAEKIFALLQQHPHGDLGRHGRQQQPSQLTQVEFYGADSISSIVAKLLLHLFHHENYLLLGRALLEHLRDALGHLGGVLFLLELRVPPHFELEAKLQVLRLNHRHFGLQLQELLLLAAPAQHEAMRAGAPGDVRRTPSASSCAPEKLEGSPALSCALAVLFQAALPLLDGRHLSRASLAAERWQDAAWGYHLRCLSRQETGGVAIGHDGAKRGITDSRRAIRARRHRSLRCRSSRLGLQRRAERLRRGREKARLCGERQSGKDPWRHRNSGGAGRRRGLGGRARLVGRSHGRSGDHHGREGFI
mmetsp:Transcript_5499/g.21737  ORF Transcript_5499/g.21737 Transcript_5499/m.21737 type:complete len:345 (-) Transcript_5499:89-1123(-)